MQESSYQVTTEYFCECLPLLKKYFGITEGYFNEELLQAKCLKPHRQGNVIKYTIKENCQLNLVFQYIEYQDLLAIINSYGAITPLLEEVLLLVAYCTREHKYSAEEYDSLIEYHTWDTYQSEWAKLVLFMEQMESRACLPSPTGKEVTSITIRTDNGVTEKISLPNRDNWLFRLIKKELADYFPNVQSAEEARRDIQNRKQSAGRKKDNALYSAVAFGIYKMFHEEKVIGSHPDMPNELCKFVYDYTRCIGCYPDNKGWSGEYDPKVIRADLAAYLKRALIHQAPQFKPILLREQLIQQDFKSLLLD